MKSEKPKLHIFSMDKEKIALVEKSIKERGYVSIFDARHLCEMGIPAIEICLKNIPIDNFIKGLNEWVNEYGK